MILTYDQRKALRRLSRGQSITRTQASDPVIRECYTLPVCPPPDASAGVVAWCDWESRIHAIRPRLTARGRELLADLDQEN